MQYGLCIEGFTASLAFELAEFEIRVKLVEPGYGPSTSFASNVGARMEGLFPAAYAPFAERIFASLGMRPRSQRSPTWRRPSGGRRMTPPGTSASPRARTRSRSPRRRDRRRQSFKEVKVWKRIFPSRTTKVSVAREMIGSRSQTM
jgi:NAD(P)-dependent dehydrogenase (short-subunit alcohol dehydrogenase family)